MHRSLQRLSRGVLVAIALMAALTTAGLLTGQVALVTTHGVSMNPTYYQGDLVLVAKAPSYQIGDIVGYRLKGQRLVVLHRIIGGDPTGFTIKGDNNQSIDIAQPAANQLVGKAALHIPGGGIWLQRLTSPLALGLIIFVLVAGYGTGHHTPRTRRRANVARTANATRTTNSPARARPAISTLPPLLRTTASVIAVIAILGLTLAGLSWTRPIHTVATPPPTNNTTMTFSYSADVGKTPAYDTTKAQSPDPIFRNLTQTVDVHYAYQGPPGTITVNARLSTADGWHSTVPLADPATISNNHYENTIKLDLEALERRAKAAAALTGLPATPVTITITPRVKTSTNTTFEPTLTLNLTPLQLTLAGEPDTLTVTDTATAPTITTNRTLGPTNWHLTVATARTIAVIALLAALLAAAILVLLAHRTAPTNEAEAIRRRHAPLLVPTHPISLPTDQPIIDVTTFATLAKLAQRYGLLILHWADPDIETFILQDQTTTYRYRTQTPPAPLPHSPQTPTRRRLEV